MIPRWIQSLTEIDSISRRQHHNLFGKGFSRTVFAEGDKVYKICHTHDEGDIAENIVEITRYVEWTRGEWDLPEGWAIPKMQLINGIIVADLIEGETWEQYLISGGMEYSEVWAYMSAYVAKHMPHTEDLIGFNVIVDAQGTHWAIDLGAEEIF